MQIYVMLELTFTFTIVTSSLKNENAIVERQTRVQHKIP